MVVDSHLALSERERQQILDRLWNYLLKKVYKRRYAGSSWGTTTVDPRKSGVSFFFETFDERRADEVGLDAEGRAYVTSVNRYLREALRAKRVALPYLIPDLEDFQQDVPALLVYHRHPVMSETKLDTKAVLDLIYGYAYLWSFEFWTGPPMTATELDRRARHLRQLSKELFQATGPSVPLDPHW